VGRLSLEGVSGGIEPGEEPLVTAQRELQEELGLAAASWQALGTVDPFTTIINSPTQLFLAEKLSFVEQSPEGTERIRRVKLAMERAVEMVVGGQITHAPTCVLLLLTDRLR
jgi:ADP-ribose pyrophosphatase